MSDYSYGSPPVASPSYAAFPLIILCEKCGKEMTKDWLGRYCKPCCKVMGFLRGFSIKKHEFEIGPSRIKLDRRYA